MPQKRTAPVEKTCPACNASFFVCPPGKSSRFYPSNNQVFCSNACAYKSRYRSGRKCANLSSTDAAYIAGFCDADGSIFLYKRDTGAKLRVTFTNSKRRVIEHILNLLQAGSIVRKSARSKQHKDSYFLQLNAELAESLLVQIEPYLILKKGQASICIAFQRALRIPAKNADKVWQRHTLHLVQQMNKRAS